jgi:RNase P subunit RPR2
VTSSDAERARVRVRCDGCGPRVIPLDGIRLLHQGERSVYVFTCDQCGQRNRRPADAAMRAVLRSAGAVELRLHNAADG